MMDIDPVLAHAQLGRILDQHALPPSDRVALAALMHVASTQQFVRLHGCVVDDYGTAEGERIWEAAREVLADLAAERS